MHSPLLLMLLASLEPQSSPVDQWSNEKSTACFVLWTHVSKKGCFKVKTSGQTRKHLNECVNMYDRHYTQWLIRNRKGFGLIINKLITHLVDGIGRGSVEVDWGSSSPCCASTKPAFLRVTSVRLCHRESTLPRSQLHVQATHESATNAQTHKHLLKFKEASRRTDKPSK